MSKYPAQLQKGSISPILIGVGIVVLLIIILIASGALKANFSVSKNGSGQPEQQAVPANESSKEPQSDKSQLKSYSNKNEGLRLNYPANWSLKENPAATVVVAFGSPKESASDTFVDNVNLSVSDLSSKPNMTLDELTDLWQKQTSASMSSGNYKIVAIKPTQLAGQDAKQLVFTYSLQGKDLKGMAVLSMKDKKAYVITYTAESASYDKFENDANSIVSSLQLD